MSKRHKNKTAREGAAVFELQGLRTKPEAMNVIPISTASPGSPVRAHLERAICRRAYELYEKRGRLDGHAEEDWLRAEAEVLGTVVKRANLG
jgi:Protein of unknown function (DUF2934)